VLTQAIYHAREAVHDTYGGGGPTARADGIVGVSPGVTRYDWREPGGVSWHRHPIKHRRRTLPYADTTRRSHLRSERPGLLTLLRPATGRSPCSWALASNHFAHQGMLQSLKQIGRNQECRTTNARRLRLHASWHCHASGGGGRRRRR